MSHAAVLGGAPLARAVAVGRCLQSASAPVREVAIAEVSARAVVSATLGPLQCNGARVKESECRRQRARGVLSNRSRTR
jgi:hypothetical protein